MQFLPLKSGDKEAWKRILQTFLNMLFECFKVNFPKMGSEKTVFIKQKKEKKVLLFTGTVRKIDF